MWVLRVGAEPKEIEDDLEVEGERVLPAQLEQQIRPPARILAPMEAFKNMQNIQYRGARTSP